MHCKFFLFLHFSFILSLSFSLSLSLIHYLSLNQSLSFLLFLTICEYLYVSFSHSIFSFLTSSFLRSKIRSISTPSAVAGRHWSFRNNSVPTSLLMFPGSGTYVFILIFFVFSNARALLQDIYGDYK